MTSSDAPIPVRHVFLVGFMGSGKSTVGVALAERLNLPFVDLDDRIEAVMESTIDEIIRTGGEERFREIETEQLRRAAEEPSQVVAVGGGGFPRAVNREIIKACGRSVWLNANFELCWKRIQFDQRIRPLAPTRTAAESRYDYRLSSYSLADIEISIDEDFPPGTIADRIAAVLNLD